MEQRTDSVDKFLPLTPRVFHILLALADQDLHGYQVMKQVDATSNGKVRVGPGTLYEAIQRLVTKGLITESSDRPIPEEDDQRRRYYRLTHLGRQILRAETERLADLIGVARAMNLLGEADS